MTWYTDKKNARRAAAEAQGFFLEETLEADILETIRKREAEEAHGAGEGEDGEEGDRDKLFREAAEVVCSASAGLDFSAAAATEGWLRSSCAHH